MAKVEFIQDPEAPKSTRSIYKTAPIERSYTLEIHGFSFTKGLGIGNYISSDTFLVGGHMWQIQFYPDGKYVRGNNHVSLFVTLVSKKCEEGGRVWFEYVLLDGSGNKWYRSKNCFKRMMNDRLWMDGPHSIHGGCRTFGYADFCQTTELEAQFVKDDFLTIQCTVGVVQTSMDAPKMVAQTSDLRQSYEQLLESMEGSDVSFEAEGETFYAHKLILSTRSPVFKAQFFGQLKEENTRLIKIDEMQAPVFKALLHFIYCDVIPDLDSKCVDTTMTQHLLVAADRYGIEKLRSLCEERLCENIAIDTVASSLALAEQHGCIELRSTCLDFIGLPENLEAVMQTDGFKNLKESCPAIIYDLLKSVARVSKHYSRH